MDTVRDNIEGRNRVQKPSSGLNSALGRMGNKQPITSQVRDRVIQRSRSRDSQTSKTPLTNGLAKDSPKVSKKEKKLSKKESEQQKAYSNPKGTGW